MENPQNSFTEQIKIALDHYDDTEWLRQHSPLATTYFLGRHLQEGKHKKDGEYIDNDWGLALQSILSQAADSLWGDVLPQDANELEQLVNQDLLNVSSIRSIRLSYLLLDLGYFRAYFHPTMYPSTNRNEIRAYLNSGRGAFYRQFKTARKRLADIVVRIVKPSFYLEYPRSITSFFGREQQISQCQAALEQKKMVMLTGNSGIGKTAVAALIGEQWQSPFFLYTFRKNLTDNLPSVLFALAHFLHQQGQSLLWFYLVSLETKQIVVAQALRFLQDDLNRSDDSFLLCFDEVDLFIRSGIDNVSSNHHLLIEFIESLREHCAILLIGQRAIINTDEHVMLSALDKNSFTQMLKHIDKSANQEQINQIFTYTKGNPRLGELMISLMKKGELSLNALPKSAALSPLVLSLWRHLADDEQYAVSFLSVFRAAAPDHIIEKPILERLIGFNILKRNSGGGIIMPDEFRSIIYDMLSAERREKFHLIAADRFFQIAEFCEGAYHAVSGGNYRAAIEAFYPHLDAEIASGKADAAYEIFQSVSLNRILSQQHQIRLRRIRNTLLLNLGRFEDVIKMNEIHSPPLPQSGSIDELYETGRFHAAKGTAYFALSNYDSSLEAYDNALEYLSEAIRLMVGILRQTSQIQLRTRNVSAAVPLLEKAELQLYTHKGFIFNRLGQFDEARKSLTHALTIAEAINDTNQIALVCHELVTLDAYQGNLDSARIMGQRAIELYEKAGSLFNVAIVRCELSYALLLCEEYHEAIKLLEKCLAFFLRTGSSDWLATAKANIAECYLGIGEIELARKNAADVLSDENRSQEPYARLVLGQIELLQNNLQKSEAHFILGIEVAKENEDRFAYGSLEREIGRYYCSCDNIQKGMKKLYSALSIFSEMHLFKECIKTQKTIEKYQSI